jgi:hypothetical protein
MLKTQLELLAIISDDLKGQRREDIKSTIEAIGDEDTIAEVSPQPNISSMEM